MLNKRVLSIILGGGRGTRLAPLTDNRSKPAVPVVGKYRLVDIPISNCINNELNRIYVLTQFNSASLNTHIKNTYQFNNFSNAFIDILAAEQTPNNDGWFQGTADAVRQCQHHFHRHDYDYVLILSGDQLYNMDLSKMIEKHKESGAEITIATHPVNEQDATSFGILKTDEKNFIHSFIEKPSKEALKGWDSQVSKQMENENRNYLASMGIYIFNRETLDKLLTDTETIDFGKEIIPQSIASGTKVFSYAYEGYWEDIGTIKAFYNANLALTNPNSKLSLFDKNSPILTRPRVLPPSRIDVTFMKRALIGEGSIIAAESLENTIVGIRSRIGKGTIIKNAYIMGANYYQTEQEIQESITNKQPCLGIGKNCFIERAVIEKNCHIGNNVIICGNEKLQDQETESYVIRDGIIVVKNGVKIADNTVIGIAKHEPLNLSI